MSVLKINPFEYFTDTNGDPLDAGYIYIGVENLDPETNPISVYYDVGLTIPVVQPIRTVNGYVLNAGAPASLYVSLAYSVRVKNKNLAQVYYAPSSSIGVLNSALGSALAASSGSSLVGFIQPLDGAVIRTAQDKMADTISALDMGILANGTDQTTALNALTAYLGSIGFRGTLIIPREVVYVPKTVFAATPLGVMLKTEDNKNWGQPPTYKNRMKISFGTGTTADDVNHMIVDTHHPALTLMNTGTSGSPSAVDRSASILHSVGVSDTKIPLNATILQFGTDVSGTKWQMGLRSLIPRAIAIKDPIAWVTGKVYAAGAMCLSDGNKVYQTTAGGTSGATAPTGTGTGINDGGVIWDYYAATRQRDSTTFTVDEDGNAANYGNTAAVTTYQVRNAANRLILEVDRTTGDIAIRDSNKSSNKIIASNTTQGIYNDGVNSLRFSTISGATPTLATTGARVTNGSAVTMTALSLPTGQTSGMCYLHFSDANTTLTHGAFQLKGAVNVNPPLNAFMVFIRNASLGSSWYEVSRNF